MSTKAFVLPSPREPSASPHSYCVSLYAQIGGITYLAAWDDIVTFEVHNDAEQMSGPYYESWPGVVRPRLEWKTEYLDELRITGA